jgi:phage tail sheath protein FI
VDVNLLFAYPDANGAVTIANDLIAKANARKDCMAFVSPPIEDSVDTASPTADVAGWAADLTSTSYASTDSSAVYIYDKYNDVYRWIGAAGHQAGLCANADNVADTWFSPAGVNRGQLLGITKLANNPVKADRDTLYKARVNPIVSLPGQGTILFGDKTLLSRPSAFDRINVRRLFIVLEKSIATAAKAQLFEFNDEFSRAQFRNLVEPFLRDIKGRRGVTDFAVVCDETNNTGQVIDTNRFVADIFVKPARSINFITLNFIATRTGVDFSEISGI